MLAKCSTRHLKLWCLRPLPTLDIQRCVHVLGNWAVVAAVMVTSSSTMIGWIHTGQVGASHLNSVDPNTKEPLILELLEPVKSLDQLRDGWVAVVAAQAKDRALVRPLSTAS